MTGEERRVIALEATKRLSFYGLEEMILYADAIDRWLREGGTVVVKKGSK